MSFVQRIDVILQMRNAPVVPLFYDDDIEVVKDIIKACYEGGARVFEFVNRGNKALDHFGNLSSWAADQLPELVLGIGSIVEPFTASHFIEKGARFIVSPLFNPEIAKLCNRKKILWIPGCGSVSEINLAEEYGAEIVKVFPAKTLGGPDFIKGVKAPCPWSNLMPSGGVEPTEENLSAWFKSGVFCVGMGSKLFQKNKKTQQYDLSAITNTMRNALDLARKYKV